MKIATWNVNSLRVRLPHVLRWLESEQPDILALQETKLQDPDFPVEEFRRIGYHAIISGQPTYNGVALLSTTPLLPSTTALPDYDDPQKRVLAAHADGAFILNLYVPNGQSLDSSKYQYKLQWLRTLDNWLKDLIIEAPHLVLLGDFNIAPDDRDVHDPVAWQNHVLVSEPERAAFQSLLARGLIDSFRLFERNAGHYSWWDYRSAAFQRNQGLRIDHILLSSELAKRCVGTRIDCEPRAWERPSDHAPVITEIR